jgi:hypothetical protein
MTWQNGGFGPLTWGAVVGVGGGGIVNYSLHFTAASSQYVDLGNTFRFTETQPFSISLWVFATSFSTSPGIFSNQSSGNGGYELFFTSSGQLHLQFFDGHSHNREVRTSTPLSTNTWYHIVYTDSGSNGASGKLYINGVEDTVAVSSTALSSIVYASSTRIGGDAYSEYFSGYIDEVSVWGAALNSTQVTALYNYGSPTDLTGSIGLTSWYPMGGGSDNDSVVYDRVGSADGTVTNGAALKQFSPFSLHRVFSQQVRNNPLAIIGSGKLYVPYYASGNTDPGYDAPDLEIWSLSSPTSPSLTGTLATTYDAEVAPYYLAFKGNYAYLTYFKGNGNFLNVIDISNPASPTIVATVNDPIMYQACQIVIVDNYAYVMGNVQGSSDEGRTDIVDISNPLSPTVVGHFTTPYFPYGVSTSGDYLYISGNGPGTIKVYDISNRTSPTVATTLTPATTPPMYSIVDGNYLYVGEGGVTGKLEVFDISNKAAPVNVATLTLSSGSPMYPVINNSRRLLFIPHNVAGTMDVVSIYDPTNPFLAGSYDLGLDAGSHQKNPTGIGIINDRLYLSSTTDAGGGGIGDYLGYLEVIQL